jgi:hypothetical protein
LTLPATITRDNQESTDSSKQNPCKRQSTATIIPSSAVADFILIDALSIQIVALQPIFHKLDETIRGHVFCSFLALVLKAELEARIAALGQKGSWPAIIGDLDALTETEVEQDARRFMLRSAPRPAASLALRAAGVALPPSVQSIISD